MGINVGSEDGTDVGEALGSGVGSGVGVDVGVNATAVGLMTRRNSDSCAVTPTHVAVTAL